MSAELLYYGLDSEGKELSIAAIKQKTDSESIRVIPIELSKDEQFEVMAHDIGQNVEGSCRYVYCDYLRERGDKVVDARITELQGRFPNFSFITGLEKIAGQNIFYIEVKKNDTHLSEIRRRVAAILGRRNQ